DPRDPEVDDLLQARGAVLGGTGDRELVDQLVRARLAWVEVDLARRAAGPARHPASRCAIDGLHRLDRLPVGAVRVGADVADRLALEAGEARMRDDEAADRLAGTRVAVDGERHLHVAAELDLVGIATDGGARLARLVDRALQP